MNWNNRLAKPKDSNHPRELRAEDEGILIKIRERYSDEDLMLLVNHFENGPDIQEMISAYFLNLFNHDRLTSYKLFLKLFLVDLEEIPLYINVTDPELMDVVKWRLLIGK
jgi:hypothetical protein